MKPFNESESGFTGTALELSNSNDKQGLSFQTWGNPERQKINEIAPMANAYLSQNLLI